MRIVMPMRGLLFMLLIDLHVASYINLTRLNPLSAASESIVAVVECVIRSLLNPSKIGIGKRQSSNSSP